MKGVSAMREYNTSGLGCGFTAVCKVCNHEFTAVSVKQTVCSTECRFELYQNKTTEDQCWVWEGPKNTQGYGRLFLANTKEGKRTSVFAHRYAYQLHKGSVPDDLCVMHTCDNPSCVNPAHLTLGTWGDNNKDRSRKGRSGSRIFSEAERGYYSRLNSGENNRSAKLSEQQVIDIFNSSQPTRILCQKYHVSRDTIKRIRNKTAWSHLHV